MKIDIRIQWKMYPESVLRIVERFVKHFLYDLEKANENVVDA